MSNEPRWVQLIDETGGRLSVIELDDALVPLAPVEAYPLQLAISVGFDEPDPTGQPYDDEHLALLAWQAALVQALGDGGRLVATLTADGVREIVAYIGSVEQVDAWQDAPPAGLGSYAAAVTLLPDPGWLGLREIAGLLGPDEEPLRAPA